MNSAGCTWRDVVRTGVTVLIATVAARWRRSPARRAPRARRRTATMRAQRRPGRRPATTAIVLRDQTALRAAPRDSARRRPLLWQGEVLEVRGERLDYLQVWDHARERGGFVRASQVHRSRLDAEPDAPELLARRATSRANRAGSEALGIGLTAAYLKAAPGETWRKRRRRRPSMRSARFADRLAQRVSAGNAPSKAAEAALAAHLEVAGRYGVRFASFERDGRMQICYDGDAFRRVLARVAEPLQQARAALALTRPECVDPTLAVHERAAARRVAGRRARPRRHRQACPPT